MELSNLKYLLGLIICIAKFSNFIGVCVYSVLYNNNLMSLKPGALSSLHSLQKM